ncbi:MAG: tyrosine--tRNA ligase [Candidatus Peribacteria bacterium]|nr:MAG: tyrosine--tRNA ligase [Candidatus Peribacteria bacterium]
MGNFCVFMQAVNYMKRGNKLYLIVGGATGMIGDPGGKDSERSFLSPEQLQTNVTSITNQVQGMLEHLRELSGHDFDFEVINNEDFYTDMSYIDFLREVGKYITINYMMTKETVKKRIEDPDKSISYTEFSYMLLQSYDYLRLYQDHGVSLQIAGSDQR